MKNIFLLLLAMVVAPLAIAKEDHTTVFIEIQDPDNSLEIWINNTMFKQTTPEYSSYFSVLSPFLHQGENQVKIVWDKSTNINSMLSVNIMEWDFGAPRQQINNLIQFKFPPEKAQEVNGKMEKTFTINVRHPYNWEWERGHAVAKLSTDDKTEIINITQKLHSYFANKQVEKIMDLVGFIFWEMSLKKDGSIEKIQNMYRNRMDSDSWKIKPLKVDSLKIEPSGKFVRVSSKNYVIESERFETGGQITIKTLYFTKIGNNWVLVRIF